MSALEGNLIAADVGQGPGVAEKLADGQGPADGFVSRFLNKEKMDMITRLF